MYNGPAVHADLERLIALQRLDTTADAARKKLADEPERQKSLDARLEAAKQRVATAKERLADNQNARRAIEKELAVHQGRLSKFREQAMAVKTNQEYHAIQHEIAHAQAEIKKHEDTILERMLDADELTVAVKTAESDAAAEQKAVDAGRKAMNAEHGELQQSLETIGEERRAIVGALDRQLLLTFEQVAKKRHGIAVAEARDGICTICHVRLRPQVFNTVRRNESIVQCDSCQCVLYFVPATAAAAAAAPAVDPSASPS
jgi:predicted  nucleic acid-binding Zn-ribbon protein